MNEKKRQEIIDGFDADNSILTNAGVFGLPFDFESSELVIYPVPWEVTTSFRGGTAQGPVQLYRFSSQIDLLDPQFGPVWKKGIFWFEEHIGELMQLNNNLRPISSQYIQQLENGAEQNEEVLNHLNNACGQLKETIKSFTGGLMDEGRKVILTGGEHSIAQGLIEAVADREEKFSVLQIDAHADLRPSYEGFEFSHASFALNALNYSDKLHFVQVGIRDYSEEEFRLSEENKRVKWFRDNELKKAAFNGRTWHDQVMEIIESLDDQVYISLDVDGLDPSLCPSAGTPVPGGMQWDELCYLLEMLKKSGKKVLAADLSETGNGEWDGIVSARLLYKLCAMF